MTTKKFKKKKSPPRWIQWALQLYLTSFGTVNNPTKYLSVFILHQPEGRASLWVNSEPPRTQQRVDTQQILKNRTGAVQSSVAEKISSKAARYSANNKNNTNNFDSHLSSCYAPDFAGSASVLLCSLSLQQLPAVALNSFPRKLGLTQVYYWK